MDLVKAEVMIGGDIRNTVVRGAMNPVTYPEVEVLRAVHGEASVEVIEVVGDVKRTPREEKARLVERYGTAVTETVYPGVTAKGMEEKAPRGIPRPKKKAAPKKAAAPAKED